MAAGPPPLRRAALLVGGAFAVHQLRFVLSYGDDAGKVLSEHGHEYLPFAAAAACVLLLLAVSQFGRSLVRAARGCEPERRAAELRRLWIENALALVAVYVVQEGLEGAFAAGHPVWAHGGWTVVPLAIAAGGLVALLLVSADRALAAVARRREAIHDRWSLEWDPPRPASASLVPRDFVARHLAGRAPPRTGLV